MIAGVNGAGKTTSIGKLAKWLHAQDLSVLLAAGDTFTFAEMSEYAAKVAHELRTPLTILRLKVEQSEGRIEAVLAEGLSGLRDIDDALAQPGQRSELDRTGADLVSVVPTHRAVDRWEHVQGAFQLLLAVATRAGADSVGTRRFAIGQYLLFRQHSYARAGGHEAVRTRIAEDLALATRVEVPVLVGTSRKRFLGTVLRDVAGADGEPRPEDRDDGTLATVVWALDAGARIVRVHDARPAARAVRLLEVLDAVAA